MNSTSLNHHLYVIKLSTLARSGYTEWDLITVNYTYQSNLKFCHLLIKCNCYFHVLPTEVSGIGTSWETGALMNDQHLVFLITLIE